MLAEVLTLNIFSFFFVFARVGTAFTIMPGFGEAFITPRSRLAIGLLISFVTLPLVAPLLPGEPDSALGLAVLLSQEVLIGFFIGGVARMILGALDVAGQIISFQGSLTSAMAFNPALATQGSLVGALLTLGGLLLIFATDGYHYILRAVIDSYQAFPPGAALPLAKMSDTMAQLTSTIFLLGFQMSAPVLVVGVLFYLALGLVGRLIPQIQVFFVALPIQIALAFVVMMMSMSAAMLWFLKNFRDIMATFTV